MFPQSLRETKSFAVTNELKMFNANVTLIGRIVYLSSSASWPLTRRCSGKCRATFSGSFCTKRLSNRIAHTHTNWDIQNISLHHLQSTLIAETFKDRMQQGPGAGPWSEATQRVRGKAPWSIFAPSPYFANCRVKLQTWPTAFPLPLKFIGYAPISGTTSGKRGAYMSTKWWRHSSFTLTPSKHSQKRRSNAALTSWLCCFLASAPYSRTETKYSLLIWKLCRLNFQQQTNTNSVH